MKSRKNISAAITSAAGLLVVFGILVAVQVIVQRVGLRADLTEEKLFTISAGTKTLLAGLDRDVTLKLYYSRSAENVPIPLRQYAQRIQDLLREYQAAGKGRLVVETYDPSPDSDEEEWAQRYGLAGQGLDPFGGGTPVYFGLVAVCGAREASIAFLSPSAEPQIEYLVTRLIAEVLQDRRLTVGVMSSLPVMGMPAAPFASPQPGSEPWAVVSELRKQYDVMRIPPSATAIPTNVSLLVLIHPRRLPDEALFAVDQFVLRGGRLVAFVDPFCIAAQETGADPSQGFGPSASEFNRLTKAWGAEFRSASAVADVEAGSQIRRGPGEVERSPLWLSLRGDLLDRDEVATASLKLVVLPVAGSFELAAKEGVTQTTLLKSSAGAGLVNSFAGLSGGAGVMQGFEKKGEMPLAVRLQGRFTTAFPDGRPAAAGPDGRPMASPDPVLKESDKPGVVVLVGDADLLYDRFSVRSMPVFGQSFYEPVNDNLGFVLNTIEQLTGNEALVGLRSRGTFDRPFERVLDLEKKAQERWQEEEIVLLEKLRAAQQRLAELQAAKSEDQQFILSPAQKQELEEFRAQQFQAQRQLKEVRKNLRSDIESLGLRIKALNIALMPALVAAFGLWHGWRRRRKALGRKTA